MKYPSNKIIPFLLFSWQQKMHKFELYERIKVENIHCLSLGRGRNRQAQRPADFPPTYEEALESPPYEEPPLVRVMEFCFTN